MSQFNGQVGTLEGAWEGMRWAGIERAYGAEDVVRLRGSVQVEHTLAELGAKHLWELLSGDGYVRALGAITGGQAVQMVKAGLEAIYLSGWQVAADGNLAGEVYPDQSLYPATAFLRPSGASTTRSGAPTRSSGPRARATRIGSPRSSPMRRPGSAGR